MEKLELLAAQRFFFSGGVKEEQEYGPVTGLRTVPIRKELRSLVLNRGGAAVMGGDGDAAWPSTGRARRTQARVQ